ncbi:MAG: hypothetical protein EOP83_06020 [Verrucomicrobiaceae bacterium]|nr:MAG: hypothetical protein EOP83_06020 [Verrucomicrobiaceae bacterium]
MPIPLIGALIVGKVVAGAGYVWWKSRQPAKPDEAETDSRSHMAVATKYITMTHPDIPDTPWIIQPEVRHWLFRHCGRGYRIVPQGKVVMIWFDNPDDALSFSMRWPA